MSCPYEGRHLAGDYCEEHTVPKKVKARTVFITAYPNIAPANTAITVKGEGSSLPVAIGRAVDQAFKHDKLKGKRIVLPMKIVVTEGGANEE